MAITQFKHDKNCPICAMGLDCDEIMDLVIPTIEDGLDAELRVSYIIERIMKVVINHQMGGIFDDDLDKVTFAPYDLHLFAAGFIYGYTANNLDRAQKQPKGLPFPLEALAGAQMMTVKIDPENPPKSMQEIFELIKKEIDKKRDTDGDNRS